MQNISDSFVIFNTVLLICSRLFLHIWQNHNQDIQMDNIILVTNQTNLQQKF